MTDIISDPPDAPCFSLLSNSGIVKSQSLGPDLFLPRARDARGRFATGSSGNPRGRPAGIPNPKRRIPDLRARPLSPEALAVLLGKQPRLLRPLAVQLLPPLPPPDPAERLGIDLSAVRAAADLQDAMRRAWAAVSRGEIAPAEAAHIARRGRTRLRALRRLARLQTRLRLTVAVHGCG
jgi:hypothetical protein